MAIVVEDGSGKSNSEAYISVSDATARLTSLGNNAAWDALASDTLREQALRKGAEYIEARYGQRWKGTRSLSTQALSWPRIEVSANGWLLGSDVVPDPVANANADLALKSLSETLNEDLTRGIVREKVGPLETEYDAYAPQAKRYPAIDGMLSPYLTGGGAARLIRA